MVWSAEHKQQILAAWDRGESASVIAARFVVSRNAIIGLVHRAKKNRKAAAGETRAKVKSAVPAKRAKRSVAVRKQQARPPRQSNNGWRQGPAKAPTLAKPYLSLRKQSDAPTVAFVDLGAHQCRFPMVDFHAADGPDIPCCGAKTLTGKSWCAHHHAIVFPPKAGTISERRAARDLVRLG